MLEMIGVNPMAVVRCVDPIEQDWPSGKAASGDLSDEADISSCVAALDQFETFAGGSPMADLS
jgi:hypothetical protein